MAAYTQNYNLIKPDTTDNYAVEDFNENADKIDEALAGIKGDIAVVTLPASGWSGNEYSLESAYPSDTYNLEVYDSSTASTAQNEAIKAADIVGSDTSNVLIARGEIPTIDLVIRVKAVRK